MPEITPIAPSLLFNGNCQQALDFYKDCFAGEITFLERYKNAPMETPPEMDDKIIHAELHFLGGMLMACDSFDGGAPSDPGIGRVSVSVQFDNQAAIEKCFAKIQQGGKVVMPLEKQFWNAIFGIVTDQFGVNWMLNCFLKDSTTPDNQ